jgi:translation initiation factor eIF-2B subunit delta
MPVELPKPVRRHIEEIRADNQSGAATLTRRAADAFLLLAHESSPERLRTNLRQAARLLVRAQPTMAPIFNLCNGVLWKVLAVRDAYIRRRVLEAFCHGFVAGLDVAADGIAARTAKLIRDDMTVMTHSYSQTVLTALRSAWDAGTRFQVICTESRPVNEGVALAGELARQGISVTLIVDSAMGRFLPSAGLALVGADAICSEGLVNKMGTSLLALAAREQETALYALCGSEKILPGGYRLPEEPPKDPAEVAGELPPNVTVPNFYFDRTPFRLLTGVITEGGIMKPATLRRRLGQAKVHEALVWSAKT